MIIVTSNRGKYAEYKQLFDEAGIDLELMLIGYPEEQLDSLEEVAERSACYLKGIIKSAFFLEDSGLFISALGGFPGVYSSYINRTLGNDGILKLMKDHSNRKAEFRTCIAYYDGITNLLTESTKGSIAFEKRGRNGFGFDPIFTPEDYRETYAEMSLEEKNAVSHRSKAASSLLQFLKKKKI